MKIFVILISFFLNFSYSLAQENLKIVTTIRPIYSIFKNIATEEISLDYLVKHQSSTHDFYLKPSDRSKLKNSDIIFIVNRNFETEIWSAIKKLGLEKKTIELTSIKNLELLDNRNLFSDQAHRDEHKHEHDDGHDHTHHHHHGPKDYHIWLSPSKAAQIAELFKDNIENKVSNPSKIKDNYHSFLVGIRELEDYIDKKVNAINDKSNFMVYHDGYQYFEQYAKLEEFDKGAIIYDHHLPGIGQTRNLVKYIKENKISCILLEPGYSKKFVSKISEKANFKTSVIDGEWGPNNAPDQKLYFLMMRALAENMVSCIAK